MLLPILNYLKRPPKNNQMKNKFLLSILLMSVLGGIIYYHEKTYSPLNATDFQKLFPNYRGNVDKIYDKDFIGFSFHNELFELYLYKMMEKCFHK